MDTQPENPCILRGMIAGAVGGLAASWVMNQFITAAMKLQEAARSPAEKQQQAEQSQQEDSEDSTMKVADALTWLLTGQHLSKAGKQKGGPIVHYAFGTLMGTLYGTLASLSSSATAGAGTAFGATLFMAADEIMVPALITGQFPTNERASSQITHFAAHIVYGTTTEVIRRRIA
jgi:putative membrane protein